MKKKFLVIVFLSFIGLTWVTAQSSDDQTGISKFGIGFHVEQFRTTDLAELSAVAPVNKLVFTISPTNHFRIEPEIGFRYMKEGTAETTLFGLGFGVFSMHQFNRINLYGGLRMELGFGSFDEQYYNGYGYSYAKIHPRKLSFAPVLGIEYYFFKSFSFGGEIGLKYTDTKYTSTSSPSSIDGTKIFGTDTGLLMRYYF